MKFDNMCKHEETLSVTNSKSQVHAMFDFFLGLSEMNFSTETEIYLNILF